MGPQAAYYASAARLLGSGQTVVVCSFGIPPRESRGMRLLLFLVAPVLRRPEAFHIGKHVVDLLLAEPIFEGWHGQIRGLVERVAHAVVDDLVELRIAVPPRMAAIVVR